MKVTVDRANQRGRIAVGAVVALLVLIPLIAWAQQEVLLVGTDTSGTTRAVQVNSSGQLVTSASGTSGSFPAACTLTQTEVAVATTAGGTATPATAATGRAYVVICNSKINSSGLLRCRGDGSAPVYASGGGNVLDIGDCVSYAVDDTVAVKCISSAGTVQAEVTDCVLN